MVITANVKHRLKCDFCHAGGEADSVIGSHRAVRLIILAFAVPSKERRARHAELVQRQTLRQGLAKRMSEAVVPGYAEGLRFIAPVTSHGLHCSLSVISVTACCDRKSWT